MGEWILYFYLGTAFILISSVHFFNMIHGVF